MTMHIEDDDGTIRPAIWCVSWDAARIAGLGGLVVALAERTKERDEAIRRAEKAERQLDQLLTAAKEAVSWHEIERATNAIDAARAEEEK